MLGKNDCLRGGGGLGFFESGQCFGYTCFIGNTPFFCFSSLGAVADIVVTDEIRDYALNQGFYFIEYAGENFYITAPKGKPKEW